MERIILASGSPRRRELLAQAGIEFDVIVSDADEKITKKGPGEIVEELSWLKANAVSVKYPERIVLGSDTIVVADGQILGKPVDEDDAVRMITALQGNTHEVYTGVTLMKGDKSCQFHEKTSVTVYPMSQEEICAYVEGKEPMDKAGAYGIQGQFAAFICKIEGDYNTVVGLPIGRVYQELKKFIKN